MADTGNAKQQLLERIAEKLGNENQSSLENAHEAEHLTAAYKNLVDADRP